MKNEHGTLWRRSRQRPTLPFSSDGLSMRRMPEMIGKLREIIWRIVFRELKPESPMSGLDDHRARAFDRAGVDYGRSPERRQEWISRTLSSVRSILRQKKILQPSSGQPWRPGRSCFPGSMKRESQLVIGGQSPKRSTVGVCAHRSRSARFSTSVLAKAVSG